MVFDSSTSSEESEGENHGDSLIMSNGKKIKAGSSGIDVENGWQGSASGGKGVEDVAVHEEGGASSGEGGQESAVCEEGGASGREGGEDGASGEKGGEDSVVCEEGGAIVNGGEGGEESVIREEGGASGGESVVGLTQGVLLICDEVSTEVSSEWVSGLHLYFNDREVHHSETAWVNDNIIYAAQLLE